MTKLTLTPHIPDPDGFYAELIAAHEGLSEAESHALNARLVLSVALLVGLIMLIRRGLLGTNSCPGPARQWRATGLPEWWAPWL